MRHKEKGKSKKEKISIVRWEISFLLGVYLLLSGSHARAEGTRDLTWFLRQLRSPESLPLLESSHTSLSGTWDRTGGNNDGNDFKRIEGPHNILLDVEGPGCIHRMFTAQLGEAVAGTHIQFILDGAQAPVIDLPVEKFFDDRHGPIPYPLVFHKTYPGVMLPVPFAQHCRVQLYNEKQTHWGEHWQIIYTQYAPGTPVQTLTWPLSRAETQEMQSVGARWLEAEKTPPAGPAQWTGEKQDLIPPGKSLEIAWQKTGVVRQWRLALDPDTPELTQQIRLQMLWDGLDSPSVDTPLGSFFGYAPPASGEARYRSLLMGIAGSEAYSCFPMPFAGGGRLRLTNGADGPVKASLRWDIEARESLPPDWGRFHATYRADRAGTPQSPRLGDKQIPGHLVLETSGRGKYVGAMLQVIWPWTAGWSEGDWLVWTDQSGWPPRYHNAGTEQYFNSGEGRFDRKALSGMVAERGVVRSVYSFHLTDAFQFQKSIRVAVETVGDEQGEALIAAHHPVWETTALWYALPRSPARSMQHVYLPSEMGYVREALTSRPATSSAPATAPATAPAADQNPEHK